MDIQDLRIFARVAQLQNLSAVGAELRLTPGTISKRIQALEEQFNARLFDRTTRSIRITEEGETFLTHVERILAEMDAAQAAIGANVEQPKGTLKIAAPLCCGRRFIAPAICAFMDEYPDINVQIDLTDRMVNLQEDGYDVAVCNGELTDSTVIAKRLAPDRQIVAASPRYLARHGVPLSPADLGQHECLVIGDGWQWPFLGSTGEVSVRVSGRLRSNNFDLLRHAAIEGQGVICASEMRLRRAIDDGLLVPLLPDFTVATDSAIYALYPSTRHLLPKLRVFLDFLGDWFRDVRSNEDRALPPQLAQALSRAAIERRLEARAN